MDDGTVMIARLDPGAEEGLREGGRRRVAERAPVVRGSEDEWVTLGDDGTVVLAVRFASKEDDAALADDPDQHAFWREHPGPDRRGRALDRRHVGAPDRGPTSGLPPHRATNVTRTVMIRGRRACEHLVS